MAQENAGTDWFDDNSPGQSSYGNAWRDRIAAVFRRATGRNPRPDELAGWGTSGDERYFQAISNAIYRTPEAVAYAQQQANGGGSTPSTPAATPAAASAGGPPSEWTLESLKAYARSKGVEWTDAQAQYWLGKKAELDARGQQIGDPNYANMRLSLADDWTAADQRYMGGADSNGFNFGDLIKPFTEQFTYQDFKAPTMDDLKADPGFQASLDRAKDSLERSAAARGSLLSGSTLKDLSDQTAAQTQAGYRDLWGRQLQTYSTNRSNAFDQYQQRRANFYQNQDSPYAKLMGMAQLESQNNNYMAGLNAQYANMGANAILGGSNAANNYATGAAASTAAGQVGAGNAYSSLFGGLAQIPWYLRASGNMTYRNPGTPYYGPGY